MYSSNSQVQLVCRVRDRVCVAGLYAGKSCITKTKVPRSLIYHAIVTHDGFCITHDGLRITHYGLSITQDARTVTRFHPTTGLCTSDRIRFYPLQFLCFVFVLFLSRALWIRIRTYIPPQWHSYLAIQLHIIESSVYSGEAGFFNILCSFLKIENQIADHTAVPVSSSTITMLRTTFCTAQVTRSRGRQLER